MTKLGVKTGLLVALLGACAAGCDGGSSAKTDARVDAKVDAGGDAKVDTTPTSDASPDTTTDLVVQPDMTTTPDLGTDAAVDMTVTPDLGSDTVADKPADMTTTPDMAPDMAPGTDAAVDMTTTPDMGTTPDGSTDVAVTHTIGGTVSGLLGTGAVLRNNGGDALTLTPGATSFAFTFATRLAVGATYNVTVQTNPVMPTQVCVVANGTGTVGTANVTNVTVTCTTSTFTVGGTVSGLTGTGLVLRNNGGSDLTVAANATTFTFPTALASGTAYAVTVQTQPGSPAQICTVASGTGTVGGANVTNVAITCAIQAFTVGGSISGLTGTGLVLRNNGADNLTVAANATSFTFATSVATGGAYAVTVFTQPAGQTCSVNTGTGTGTVATANVTTVAITCVNTYTVGGTITGYTGSGLVLRNNGGDDLTVPSGATTFTFGTRLLNSAAYAVTVHTNPSSPAQTCTVAMGSGTISAANVSNVAITCTSGYTIGGTISGLTVAGLVLRNNGGDDLTVPANATTFTFATSLNTAATYNVTVQTQPSAAVQCAVMGTTGMGTVASANITSVVIQCTPRYTVGGTISGLTAGGLVLRLNGMASTDLMPASGATMFTFAPPLLATGTAYAVTVQTNPTGLTCTVAMGSGNIAAANITNVTVTCGPASTAETVCAVEANPSDANDALEITDNEMGVVTCPTGKHITAVTFASYGTPTGTCPNYVAGSCDSGAAGMTYVMSQCPVGATGCTITPDWMVNPPNGFGDPCGGTTKNMRIAVTCQ